VTVRFLIDAQLPPSLAAILRASGHDAVHLFDHAPADADDAVIWRIATTDNRVILTKDEDFAIRSKLKPGPRVVWLRIGNCSNVELRAWLNPLLPSIIHALEQGDQLVILLR
jgi:predicted nuclease of predicted toxin-antitoxin system